MNSFLSSLIYGNGAEIEDAEIDDFDIARDIKKEVPDEGDVATRRQRQGGILGNGGGSSDKKKETKSEKPKSSRHPKNDSKKKKKKKKKHVEDDYDDLSFTSTSSDEEQQKVEEEKEKEDLLTAEKSRAITASLDALYTSEHNSQYPVIHNPLLLAPPAKDDIAEESEPLKELRLWTDRRSKEWKGATDRWQKRTVNLVKEYDVGKAAAKRTRTLLRQVQPKQQHLLQKQKQQQQQQQQRPQVEESTTRSSSKAHAASKKRKRSSDAKSDQLVKPDDTDIVDSSDEEQDQIFVRLSQNQELPSDEEEHEEDESPTKKKEKAKAAKAAQRLQSKLKRARTSHFEGMDYWQKGRTAPSRDEFLLELESKLAPETAHSAAVERILRKKASHGRKKPTGVTLSSSYDKAHRPDPNVFLQFPIHHQVNIDHEFLHRRQLVRLATRHMLGSVEREDPLGLEDRFLRALWETPGPEQDRRLFFLLTQTQQQGINLQTFLSHQWKDDASYRMFVAKRLGVVDPGDHNDLLGPSHMVGQTLFASQVRYLYDQERRRLVGLYSSGLKPASNPATEISSTKTTMTAADDPQAAVKDDELTTQQGRQEQRQQLIAPSVNYIHVPGSIPPIPSFPFNEADFAFGPRDKHIAFRHSGPVDEATYNLTLSSLLSRISAMPALHKNKENHELKRRALQRQLQTLVEQSPTAASTMLHIFFRMRNDVPTVELPLVQFYRTMAAYCAFVASRCPQPTKPIDNRTSTSNHDDEDDPPDMEEDFAPEVSSDVALDEMESLSLDVVAKKVFDVCQTHLQHDGLQAFPRLHLTYELARIAKMLPPSAAEILSRPLDDLKHRTPFDILRNLMEHMEDEHMLDDASIAAPSWSSTVDRVKVRVGELEYELHQAASSLCKCIERDPVDVNYHAWYLGTLATSMLLCSGNRVGSKAFPYPSSHYDSTSDNDDSDSSSIRSGSVEMGSRKDHPRRTLANFDRLRQAVKKGLKVFMHLCRRQPECTRAHLVLSSFLEWSQVVALIAGKACLRDGRLQELRDVHHHHATQWAVSDRSSKAIKYLHCLNEVDDDLPNDAKLNHLATSVENDPDNTVLWRRLVAALGPVGVELSGECQRSCVDENCVECSMLHEGVHIDHHILEARKSSGQWWGSDRLSWWYTHFLALPHQESYEPLSPLEIEQLEITMKDIQCHFDADPASGGSNQSPLEMNSNKNLEWLCEIEDKSLHGERKTTAAHLSENDFPKSFVEALKTGVKTERYSSLSESEDSISEAEVLYLKLAVTCHLYGVTHPGLVQGVCQMAQKSVDDNFQIKDCEERRYIQELSNLGLDISRYLKAVQELPR